MGKYPVLKEFRPFSYFLPPLNRATIALAGRIMRPPAFFWRDPDVTVERQTAASYDGAPVELYILTPGGLAGAAPCLVNFHGGGFVLEGAGYHYRLALEYAKGAECKVVFVRYRLAPRYPFPVFFEDCYAAVKWVWERRAELGVDPGRIGVGGDSAGGTLSAAVCMMARDRGLPVRPRFQMLVYPYLDRRGNSESARRFTDTPMWNSRLTRVVAPLINAHEGAGEPAWFSPVEAERLEGLPPAYIETAEFDCLHDDGIFYARRLKEAGVEVELRETRGTMHGFDIVTDAPTTRLMVQTRVNYMRRMFHGPNGAGEE